MKPSMYNDYEIDILIGKLAAVLVIVRGSVAVWHKIAENKGFISIAFFVLLVFIPCLYLFFLKIYNLKFAKLIFQIWFYSILLLCLSVTGKLLADFSGFWKVIFPAIFVTVCMLIGLKGVIRIKDPTQLKEYIKGIKIPETNFNLYLFLDSISNIIALVSIVTFMVLIGKYFHDFILINWPSLEKDKILFFYIGIAIGYYPSKILGAAISCIFNFLVNLIYKYCVASESR